MYNYTVNEMGDFNFKDTITFLKFIYSFIV